MNQKIVIGGGCFWCLDAVFRRVPGVKNVVSGYAGGQTKNPDYKSVCSGTTGHAEVVEIEYDSGKVSYSELLNLFFKTHDPTTLNRQGNDVGTQYRSVIFYQNGAEKELAEQAMAAASEIYKGRIVTELAPLVQFFPAESYHQDYYANNPGNPYCMYVIAPKLDKL